MAHTEQKVHKATERATQVAEDVVDTVASTAKAATQHVGEYIESAQEGLQDKIRKTGRDVTEVVSAVSDKVRSSANYVQDQGVSGLVDDAEVLIRRYPIHTLCVGILLGILIGQSRSR